MNEKQPPINSIVILIDLMLSQLNHSSKSQRLCIPEYLIEQTEWEKQGRVRRGLIALQKMLCDRTYWPDGKGPDTIAIERYIPVLLAILFSAVEARYQNLYELKAAKKMLHPNNRRGLRESAMDVCQAISASLGVNLTDSEKTLKLAARLLLFHKMADRVIYDRLAKSVYNKIFDSIDEAGGIKPQMGLVSAANYNSSGELNDISISSERINMILNAWVSDYPENKEEYDIQRKDITDKDDFDVLWDYPLCHLKEDEKDSEKREVTEESALWAGRYHLNQYALSRFIAVFMKSVQNSGNRWWHKDGDGIGYFVTINYVQSRFLLNPEFRIDLAKKGSNIYKHSKFKFEEILDLHSDLGLGNKVIVYEFQLNPKLALMAARGEKREAVKKMESNEKCPNKPFLEDFSEWIKGSSIRNRGGSPTDYEKVSYYQIPIEKYIPLPLLARYFRIAASLDKDSFETCVISIEGQLEASVPNTLSLVVPIFCTESQNKRMQAIIERFIAAYVINLGLCYGFDRIHLTGANAGTEWRDRIATLLGDRKSGFELMMRYIEIYMRSHEVYFDRTDGLWEGKYWKGLKKLRDFVWEEKTTNSYLKSDSDSYIGIDIGAGTIKYRLYQQDGKRIVHHRDWSFHSKVEKPEGGRYKSLNEFAERIVMDIKLMLAAREKPTNTFKKIKALGVCWPGPIREQKIAGASGILKNFTEEVASNFIRKTSVDQVRKLDLISNLHKALKASGEEIDITIGLCNDAYAEALGRIVVDHVKLFPNNNDSDERPEIKWCVLKLGSGTASAAMTEDLILRGPSEAGKYMLNVYCDGEHSLEDEDKAPEGQLNMYASAKLTPYVYSQVVSTSFQPDSREIAKVFEYQTTHQDTDELIYDVGCYYLQRKQEGSLLKEPQSISSDGLKFVGWNDLRLWCNVLGVADISNINSMVKSVGFDRLALLSNLADDKEKLSGVLSEHLCGKEGFMKYPPKIYDCSSAVLADSIMLLREHYQMTGVVLCGGVFGRKDDNGNCNKTGERILEGIKVHLEQKYGVNFQGCDKLEEDVKNYNRLGKKKRTTIYYLVNSSTENPENNIEDRGEIGALCHALLLKTAKEA